MSEGAPMIDPAAASRPLNGLGAALALVGHKLALVEEEIQANLRSPFDPIDRGGQYLADGGGKRLRPMLVLLSSGLVSYRGDHDVLVGAVFEFIHTATLVHDDIIDEAEVRRGKAAANRVFGNEYTVLLGDYLYIRSMNMALKARNLRVIDLLAEATEKMIEGELLGNHLRGRADVTREQHLQIVERKTAWLFSACCRAAAVLAGSPKEVEERLAAYGQSLGIAFQLVDDLLDVTADEATVGKPVAQDLREGRLTLPWIDLLERGSARERDAVLAVLRDGESGTVPFAELRDALERLGCVERTRKLAVSHARHARQLMQAFPPGPYRDVLLDLPDAVVARDR